MAILNITTKRDMGDLIKYKNSISGPWGIFGDFNEILHSHETIGGATENSSRMQNFAEFIDDCHLMEL